MSKIVRTEKKIQEFSNIFEKLFLYRVPLSISIRFDAVGFFLRTALLSLQINWFFGDAAHDHAVEPNL